MNAGATRHTPRLHVVVELGHAMLVTLAVSRRNIPRRHVAVELGRTFKRKAVALLVIFETSHAAKFPLKLALPSNWYHL